LWTSIFPFDLKYDTGRHCKTEQASKCSTVSEWKTQSILLALLHQQSNMVIIRTGKKQWQHNDDMCIGEEQEHELEIIMNYNDN
jgi:hypothetical protein